MKSTQTIIPIPLRKEMEIDPEYKSCALFGQMNHTCEGRITWEHAIIAKGSKVQKKWAIVPLCAKAHAVDQFQDAGTMIKEINEWIALSRASDTDLLDLFGEKERTPLCKANTIFMRKNYLVKMYGEYSRIYPPAKPIVEMIFSAARKHMGGAKVYVTDATAPPTTFKPGAIVPGPKKHWYLLTKDDEMLVQRARKFHEKSDAIYFNDYQMIELMIREYCEERGLARERETGDKHVDNYV